MAETTAIEWCDATLNLWWGCTKVSAGCKNCYAETLSDRYGRNNWGPNGVRQEVKSWRETLRKIAKRAEREERRLRVFVQSMSDLFEGPETMGGEDSENWRVTSALREEFLVGAVWDYPQLDFLVLTKRPELAPTRPYSYPDNVWMGVSVEDEGTAETRIPHLLAIPASIRFLSCEPLLGPLDLAYLLWDGSEQFGTALPGIDWVIVGGESGTGARPMAPEWARSIRDDCVRARTAFFFKQWGEFSQDGVRVGKKRAGRLLDGCEWSQFPEVNE